MHVVNSFILSYSLRSDFNIKVPLVASPSKTKVLSGHEAPILSLSFDATDDYLASASCDGSVRIWKLSEEKCVHTEKSLEKGNDIRYTVLDGVIYPLVLEVFYFCEFLVSSCISSCGEREPD